MNFEDFLITENSEEMVKSWTDVAPVPSHSFRLKMVQRTSMCCMVTKVFYY